MPARIVPDAIAARLTTTRARVAGHRLACRKALRVRARRGRDADVRDAFALRRRPEPRSVGRGAVRRAPTTPSCARRARSPTSRCTRRRRRRRTKSDAARVATFFHPYHHALAAEIERVRARHGYAMLLDGHSIRGEVPRFFAGRLPDLNLGTADGASCAPSLQAHGRGDRLAATPRFTHVVNGRFKGGWITRRYGRPADGVHALQLEMAQRCYMDEAPPYRWTPARAAPLARAARAARRRARPMAAAMIRIYIAGNATTRALRDRLKQAGIRRTCSTSTAEHRGRRAARRRAAAGVARARSGPRARAEVLREYHAERSANRRVDVPALRRGQSGDVRPVLALRNQLVTLQIHGPASQSAARRQVVLRRAMRGRGPWRRRRGGHRAASVGRRRPRDADERSTIQMTPPREQQRERPEPQQPRARLHRRIVEDEIAVARDEERADLVVALAGHRQRAHFAAKIVGQPGAGIGERLVLADEAAQLSPRAS